MDQRPVVISRPGAAVLANLYRAVAWAADTSPHGRRVPFGPGLVTRHPGCRATASSVADSPGRKPNRAVSVIAEYLPDLAGPARVPHRRHRARIGPDTERRSSRSTSLVRGRASPRNEEPALHFLFVCTGNICRSPTAERLAVAYSAGSGIKDFTAASAGTHAMVSHPIHPDARSVLAELGGDASNFAARRLTPKVAAGADLVLTMTTAHRDRVLEVAPQKLHRTFTLIEAARLVTEGGARSIDALANLRPQLGGDRNLDIADPIGQRPEVFAAVGALIVELLPPVLELCRPA